MSLIFKDKHEGIPVQLTNREDKVFNIETLPITMEDYDKILKISKQMQKEFEIKQMYDLLYIFFGKGKEFFKQFTVQLLTDLILSLKEEIVKKNSEEQNG